VKVVIAPKITGDLPVHSITPGQHWNYLDNLQLANPDYYKPDKVDLLLDRRTFVEIICYGRWCEPRESPTVLNTEFAWILAGSAVSPSETKLITTHMALVTTGDDILPSFGKSKRE